jgi:hypothetical protein
MDIPTKKLTLALEINLGHEVVTKIIVKTPNTRGIGV